MLTESSRNFKTTYKCSFGIENKEFNQTNSLSKIVNFIFSAQS